MRRVPGIRTKAFVLFLLQLLLAGAAPIVDARLEAETSHARVHLDSGDSEVCGLGHDHRFCTLCRALDMGAAPEFLKGIFPHHPPAQRPGDPCFTGLRHGGGEATHHSSRAPPLA